MKSITTLKINNDQELKGAIAYLASFIYSLSLKIKIDEELKEGEIFCWKHVNERKWTIQNTSWPQKGKKKNQIPYSKINEFAAALKDRFVLPFGELKLGDRLQIINEYGNPSGDTKMKIDIGSGDGVLNRFHRFEKVDPETKVLLIAES